jgi:hypothetical protein
LLVKRRMRWTRRSSRSRIDIPIIGWMNLTNSMNLKGTEQRDTSLPFPLWGESAPSPSILSIRDSVSSKTPQKKLTQASTWMLPELEEPTRVSSTWISQFTKLTTSRPLPQPMDLLLLRWTPLTRSKMTRMMIKSNSNKLNLNNNHSPEFVRPKRLGREMRRLAERWLAMVAINSSTRCVTWASATTVT